MLISVANSGLPPQPSLRGAEGDAAIQSQRLSALDCFATLTMTREIDPYVYIMANKQNGTLYTGVTSDLPKRIWQHREGVADGFTKRYDCKMLVWYEKYETMESAIMREKQIKAGSRAKKIALIEKQNAEWRDLYDSIAHG